ncbi:glutathione peroxidase [Leucobacter chromiiresistens]|uniref:Glutathione peroxidase n=1 Tax=Leucobacter chromiiresistens TaxID=1079994 RepID=A0A147ENZ2_9MICO|nr:glutathione peroxidase [Leucobacter chromiiresistens]KTR86203.1 glutathione peroxidase [Leucobacter chromiiresistens]
MELRDIPFTTIDGEPASLADYADRAVLIVNVASKCGLTPQYEKLEALQRTYGERGLTVLGFPCNQFMGQEPGDGEEIKTFCSTSYGVSFPLMEKVKVNGRNKHPLYEQLREVPDAAGKSGRVKWNFEKFLVAPDGSVSRFRPTVEPDDPAVIAAIEAALPE